MRFVPDAPCRRCGRRCSIRWGKTPGSFDLCAPVGTRVRFPMTILGLTRELLAVVSEPEPGRKLVEVIEETGAVTNFLFNPTSSGETRVTIEMVFPLVAGVRGAVERWITRRTLPRIYREELQRLADVCKRRGCATP